MYPLTNIYRYPVKGLAAEVLARVALSLGEGLPHDRAFAFAKEPTAFDPAVPKYLFKSSFLQLMQHEKLIGLRPNWDGTSGILAVVDEHGAKVQAKLGDAAAEQALANFVAARLGPDLAAPVRLVHAAGHCFGDCGAKVVSLIGLASLRALAKADGGAIDPLRFRANIYFDGAPAWAEFDWSGREIAIGAARLKVLDPIGRCAATNVDPVSGRRDRNLPKALHLNFGHADMGVYATVIGGGEIAIGDAIRLA